MSRYSDTLRRVAPILAEHHAGRAILRILATFEREADGPSCRAFDTAEAVYWLGNDYHDGQFSPLYRALCATGYEPGRSQRGPEKGGVAEIIYAACEVFVR